MRTIIVAAVYCQTQLLTQTSLIHCVAHAARVTASILCMPLTCSHDPKLLPVGLHWLYHSLSL